MCDICAVYVAYLMCVKHAKFVIHAVQYILMYVKPKMSVKSVLLVIHVLHNVYVVYACIECV